MDIVYPIISETTDETLKIAPSKLWGPEPNCIGNLCIIGHNYTNLNGALFSGINKLKNGDLITITSLDKYVGKYEVYDHYEVADTDLEYTRQSTNGNREITLITCTNNSKKRLIVKCIEI